jgi:hypothetical protein
MTLQQERSAGVMVVHQRVTVLAGLPITVRCSLRHCSSGLHTTKKKGQAAGLI